jgi:DNA-binding response OmpR family regulator
VTSQCLCPTCGQALPDTGLKLHVDAGIVLSGTRFVALPRREMLILEYLYAKRGNFVSREQVFNAVYDRNDDLEFDLVVESHISKLKKKVAALGLKIRSQRFRGYQLTVGECT